MNSILRPRPCGTSELPMEDFTWCNRTNNQLLLTLFNKEKTPLKKGIFCCSFHFFWILIRQISNIQYWADPNYYYYLSKKFSSIFIVNSKYKHKDKTSWSYNVPTLPFSPMQHKPCLPQSSVGQARILKIKRIFSVFDWILSFFVSYSIVNKNKLLRWWFFLV